MKHYYNLNHLIKATIQETETVNTKYVYYPAQSYFWGLLKRKEHIEYCGMIINKKRIEHGARFDEESKTVVNLRFIKLFFANEFTAEFYYDSAETLEKNRKNLIELCLDAKLPIDTIFD